MVAVEPSREDPRLRAALEAMELAHALPAPEWVRDLCWQVGAGFMTGDQAVAVILDEHPRHPCLPPDGLSAFEAGE